MRALEEIKRHPKDLLARIILLNTDPIVPDFVKRKDSGSSKREQFAYFKKHYWANTNFSDPRLLSTPYYYQRLHRYFEDLTLKQSREMIRSVDSIMLKASAQPAFFTFTFDYISNRFYKPTTMGDDAVFVHLIDVHLNNGTESWIDSTNVFRLRVRAANMKLSLIGQIAPDLNLPDLKGKRHRLRAIKDDTTVMIFYNTGCGIENLTVYAVCTDGSRTAWKKYIEANEIQSWTNVFASEEPQNFRRKYDVYSVPLIFVLDENKVIKAKQLQADQLDFYLRERMN